jgi:alkaline phosphatase
MTTRREFLKQAGLFTAAMATGAPAVLASATAGSAAGVPASKGKPRRVIFLVADGMSQGVPSLAHQLSLRARKMGTSFHDLLADPAVAKGLFECYSLESLVTDSAAASSAWGSGVRILNRGVNTLADDTKLTPILPLIKDLGYGTGLVTTARVTHATPAGFAAAVPHRDSEELIAPQYAGVVDVILGGGTEFFDPAQTKDKADNYALYRGKGYEVVTDRAGMMKAGKDKPLLGVFHKGHLPYTLDQMNDKDLQAKVPTLAEMTEKALELLEANEKGFLLQVEGARVDHAAHANDAASILWDQLAFDDAVKVALEFQKRHPETLVVVTSDHGNSNPGLNGSGDGYGESNGMFEKVALAKASFSELENRLKAAGSERGKPLAAEKCREILVAGLGLDISLEDAALVAEAAAGKKVPEVYKQHQRYFGILGQVVGNHNGIGWTSTSHTEDHTIIAAKGPGQEHFGRLIPNTDCFVIFSEIFGVTHKNPTMSLEESLKHRKKEARMGEDGSGRGTGVVAGATSGGDGPDWA